MPDESTPSPETPPPYNPARRVGTGLAGESTRNADSTILPEANPRPLEVIGDFEVMSKLGQGGMGAVYRARQVSLDRQVALKILPANFEADADYVSRFEREARVAANLSHANLVKVYAAGVADGCHYIAMELIEGETLGQWIKQPVRPPLESLRIILDVARALEYGWRTAQLIHRDIKPGNIFLSVDGAVKLGDLGLAKVIGSDSTGLTQTGTAMGTPHYISPEQARGDRDIDFRADIYSLGCTLFQMITGRTPYSGTDAMAVMSLHRDGPPPAILKVMPQCPLPLARLVSKMLKKQRRERPASYEELIAALESVRAQLDPSLASPSLPPPSAPETIAPVTADAGGEVSPPVQAKSKLPLYGGIGVLVLAVAAFFLWPREEKLTKAQIYAREHAGGHQAGGESAPPASGAPSTEEATGNREAGGRTGSGALEPGAIRLFDTPEKVAHHIGTGFIWDNGTIRLDKRGADVFTPTARDAILRCAVRMNLDSVHVRLSLRQSHDSSHKMTCYYLELNPVLGTVSLTAMTGSGDKHLHSWKLPRTYLPDEWLRLELRAVGEELTVSADGTVLGTVGDTSITQTGGVTLYASANGYFRDIVYVPLDNAPNGSASTPTSATKDAPFVNTLGMKFVPVPIIGGPTGGKAVLFSVWDTRVQDYEVFVKETKREWGSRGFEQEGPTHPAVSVPWDDAQAFCAWLTERERKAGKLGANEVYRLPTDHEWSCAVGIGEREDAAKLPNEKSGKIADVYPWGTQWPPPENAGNYASEELRPLLAAGQYATGIKGVIAGYHDGFAETSPVGSFAANQFGLYDMGSNVCQWCEDWYDKEQKDRVLRGASWAFYDRRSLLLSDRFHRASDIRYAYNGFRCVVAPASSTPPANLSTATYPQPPKWIDATAAFRSTHLADGSVIAEGDWLKGTMDFTADVSGNLSLRNSIVRVIFSERVILDVRQAARHYYLASINQGHASIRLSTGTTYPILTYGNLDSPDRLDGEHEAVFAAQGDALTLWLDGKVVATAHDSTLPAGSLAVGLVKSGGRIKKVEYGELPAAAR